MKIKTLLLFEEIWRCGGPSPWPKTKLGLGETELLNDDGYMCCLGQFSKQLSSVADYCIMGVTKPKDSKVNIPDLTFLYGKNLLNTDLSEAAIFINDGLNTSIKNKVSALTKLFASYGYEIIFIPK